MSTEQPPIPAPTPALVLSLDGGTDVVLWRPRPGERPSLAMVESVARLRLEALRWGCSVWLRDPCPGLSELVELAGLTELLCPRPPEHRAEVADGGGRTGEGAGAGGSGSERARAKEGDERG